MNKSKKIAQVDHYCVACGTCIKECPLNAIEITKGMKAEINSTKCVGCGKCSKICPASSITMLSREATHEE